MILRSLASILLWMVILYFCLPTVAGGQGKLDAELWDVEKGLTNREVFFAARDQQGFLWILSSDLERYDGHEFTSIAPYDSLEAISLRPSLTALQYSDSTLILSSLAGLYTFNMSTQKFQALSFPRGMQSDSVDLVRMIQKDHHPDFLVVTRKLEDQAMHLLSRDWKHLLSFPLPKRKSFLDAILRSYANGPSGTLWLMERKENRIFKITKDGVDTLHFDREGRLDQAMLRIIHHERYGLLLVQNNGNLYAWNEKQKDWQQLLNPGLEPGNLSSVHLESSGHLWLTFSDKIVDIDLEARSWTIFRQGLFNGFSPHIHYLFEDREKTTWYCTSIGLVKINEQLNPFLSAIKGKEGEKNIQYREIFPTPNPQEIITRLAKDQRHLVKLTYRDDLQVDTVTLFRDVSGHGVLQAYRHYLLHVMPNTDQLTFFDLQTLEERTARLPVTAASGFRAQFIVEGRQLHYQDINNNITVYDLETGKYRTVVLQEKEKFRGESSLFMRLDHGRYIQGQNAKGLTVHDARSGKLLHHFSSKNRPELTGSFMNSLVMNGPDSLWLGSLGGGMIFINLQTDKIKSYTTSEGLANNMIASIIEDDLGNLWLGTYRGLSRFNKRSGEFYNYYTSDGIPHNEFNYLSTYKASNGVLYIGTFNGIVRFDPRVLLEGHPLPRVALSSIQKYNRQEDQLLFLDSRLDQLSTVKVSPYDNYIQFNFAVPSFTNVGNYSYQVMLEGLDEDWQDLRETPYIRYRKLPAGLYTFRVKARDSNNNETIADKTVQVKVNDFFYNTWWFRIIAVIVLFGAFNAFYKYRLNLLRKTAETRIRIARDLHDEIGSSMTRISMQLQLLEPTVQTKQRAALQKVGKIVDESVVKLRDLVWAIDKSSDHWKDVLERMEDYAYDTLLPKEIIFSFQQQGIDPERMLAPNDKRNLYLIFKESINNVAKHSNADRVTAVLKNERYRFVMSIVDNGVKSCQPKQGHGLANIQIRAKRMGGQLHSRFMEDGGFRIDLEVPRQL